MTRPSARLQPVAAGVGVEFGDVTVNEYQRESKIYKWPKATDPLKALLTFAFLCSDEVAFVIAVSAAGVSVAELYLSAVERRLR